MSLPIDQDLEIGPWSGSMKGRYLNGTATLQPELVNGQLKLHLEDFRVKGKSVPGWLLSQLQYQIDELEWLHSDDVRDTISGLSSIVVTHGRLTLHPN